MVLFSTFVANIEKLWPMEKNLTKEKFEIFMMLCAAGIDGNISMNELERICLQFDEKSYNEVFESWKSMTSPAACVGFWTRWTNIPSTSNICMRSFPR